MNTIDTIVQELKQIPEPIQLSVLNFIRSLSSNLAVLRSTEIGVGSSLQKHYPLRGMPIHIAPDFDEPMTDLWDALGE
ncbi:MAG: hypothetical protein RLZZ135_2378 [Cyanobacteriota bacterium]|jgi:hypothetical protein